MREQAAVRSTPGRPSKSGFGPARVVVRVKAPVGVLVNFGNVRRVINRMVLRSR